MIRIKVISPLIIGLLSVAFSNAQEIGLSELSSLTPFVGTWVSIEENDSLMVELEMITKHFKDPDVYIDQLVGRYKFISESKLEADFLDSEEFSLKGGRIREQSGNKFIEFSFHDQIKDKMGVLLLYIDDVNNNRLLWRLSMRERIFINEEPDIEELKRFSVPNELTLFRVDSD